MKWFIWLSQLFYLLLLLHFQLTSSSSFSSSSALLCSQVQSSALLQFKHLFSFSESASFLCDNVYPKMESWKVGTDCCSWDGVTCDRVRGDVIGLDLSCSWLYGTIPSNIRLFLLPHLQHLNLAFNDFSLSPISSGFGQFATLRYLNLSGSWFSSQVPLKLSHLSQLTSLDLSHNACQKFDQVKRTYFNLMKLTCPLFRFLDVSSTTFSRELPKSIGNLKFLRNLGLNECSFTGSIPTSLGLISASLGNLTKVTEIFLKSNNFIGHIPSSLSFLKDLSSIDLSNNNFEGKIPKFLTNLTKLIEVDLSNNQLTSQIGEFHHSNPLQILRVANNKLYGSIPKSISNFANLRDLDISSNNLSGIVDFDKLTKLKYLQDLDLSYNSISLSIKSKLNYTFPSLQYVKLVSCNIVEFPNFLTLSKKLDFLDLSNNRIYGRIPEWIFEIGENLRYLNLSHNFLSRKFPIPPFSTEILFISNNSLIGNIPSMICNISSLRLFDLSHNSLSGTLPQCLGNISESIQVMDLRMNNFHGAIPNTFAKDNQLITLVFNVLDLGNNKINYRFPYWLEALPELKVLVLKSNRFYGPIENHKTSGNIFSKLRILDLSHNGFTGVLPRNYFQNLNAMMTKDEGKKQQYMGEIDYYQDLVVMTIPKVLARLTILRLLNLSHNSLTGHIPLSLANLLALESLDLSSHRLIGDIHIQLTSLTFLAKLNLSRNQLTGPIPQGKQFGTFENNSYYGNLGLCGFPLSIKCSNIP
ncbi:hypothetical protein ACJW31_06G224300 [Castanea mollissima]